MPLVQTRGAASAQGFGEFAQVTAANYIEDVFSTFLYTGTNANQTITNNIDISGKGGMVWLKTRSTANDNTIQDTVRGNRYQLLTNNFGSSNINGGTTVGVTGFTSTGFTLGTNYQGENPSGSTMVSWTFAKQSKFFDIQTWSGSGANRTISHLLGSVPGSIWVKRTDANGDWQVYHRSLANTEYLVLNDTAATATGATRWNSTTPTSTVFSLGTDASVNASAGTYIAYIFAHDAGGFGLTGTDNVISCGGFTANGNNTITLGYEPQWVMVRRVSSAANDWEIYDTMRGMSLTGTNVLYANTSGAEGVGGTIYPTATGFYISSFGSGDIIYIAIRRGPMKVPTTGTSVYNAIARSGNSTSTSITGVGFVPDLTSVSTRTPSGGQGFIWQDRLRGATRPMFPSITQAETTYANEVTAINQDGITVGTDTPVNQTGYTYINHFFGRAPSFFDEVCYTGTGSNTTQTHNLGAVPELIIVKGRSGTTAWQVYSSALANTEYLVLNTTAAKATGATRWNSTTPTSSVFSLGTASEVNTSAATYVAYLFATCAGVSKVGSYTGNGTTQTINCGFGAGGARFVLIKRTDSTGNWYVYDSTRGMTVLTDPYLWLNDVVVEVASLGSVIAVSTGFALDAAIVAAINTNAASYIFLAIA